MAWQPDNRQPRGCAQDATCFQAAYRVASSLATPRMDCEMSRIYAQWICRAVAGTKSCGVGLHIHGHLSIACIFVRDCLITIIESVGWVSVVA